MSSKIDAPGSARPFVLNRLTIAGLMFLPVGLLLPVQATAHALARDPGLLPQVVIGVWIFKALLVVHALAFLLLARLRVGNVGENLLADHAFKAVTPSRMEWLTIAALLVVAAGLRLYDLSEGLWYDEIQTLVRYARLPMAQIISTFDSQNQHMLYSLMARAAVAVFGETAWAIRLPAVLFGVASLAALYLFALQITGRIEALIAVALLTFSYHHVWFSQNARGYTGLLFWTLVGSALFLRLLTDRTAGWHYAIAYAALMALAVYTHVTALFVVAAHGLIWLALLARSRRARGVAGLWRPLVAFALAGSLSLQLYALVLPQFIRTLAKPTMEGMNTQWKDPLWFITETVRGLAQGVPGGMVTVVAALAIATTGIVSYARRSGTVAALMLLPGAMMAGMLLVLEHNLWPRFFFFAAGFAVLIAVRGAISAAEALWRARGRTLAVASLGIVVLCSAATVPAAWQPKQDFAGARAFIERNRVPGDAVVTVDMSNYAFGNYAAPNFQGVANEAELDSIEKSHRRTWILYTFPTRLAVVQPGIWSRIQTNYRAAAEFHGTVGGGAIVVKVKS